MHTDQANQEINGSITVSPEPINKHSIPLPGSGATTPEEQAVVATLRGLAKAAYANSVNHGFWLKRQEVLHVCTEYGGDGLRDVALKLTDGQQIALMHSELSEALEGSRKDLQDDHLPQFDMLTVELADVLIRIMDHAGAFSLPIGEAVIAKMAFNAEREYMHGGKRF